MKLVLFFLITGLVACQQSGMEQYSSLVKKELSGNKKVNDIFFGISLGMTSKDFYVHCWNLNKKGTFRDGAGNTSVLYELNNKELKHEAEMNFYPEFNDGRIHKLWAKFRYKGWMPWNKELGADKLLPDVVNFYGKWYPAGNPFLTVQDARRGTLYVKIDGNRQIVIGTFDDTDVKVEYTDLSVEK
jgi:hypothetical protein